MRQLHGILYAVLHAHLDGWQVLGKGHGAAQRNGTLVLVVVVVGRPDAPGAVVDGHGVVEHDVRGQGALFNSAAVDEGLEGRAGLAQRLHGAVELAFVEVAAAGEGAHRAGGVVDHDGRGLHRVVADGIRHSGAVFWLRDADALEVEREERVHVDGHDRIWHHEHLAHSGKGAGALVDALLQLHGLGGDGAVGSHLDLAVHGGVGGEPRMVQGVLAPGLLDVLAHRFQKVGAVAVGTPERLDVERGAGQLLVLVLGDVLLVGHGLQDHVAPSLGAVRIAVRAQALGPLDEPRKQCGFLGPEVFHVLAEVDVGCRLHAVGAGAQVDLVQVIFQNLVFGVVALQQDGGDGLLDLSPHVFLLVQEDVAGQLLGDGGSALRLEAMQVGEHRSAQAGHVDAPVVVEAAVLNGDHRLAHHRRNGVNGAPGAALDEELSEGLAVLVQDLGREDGRDRTQVVKRRDLFGIVPYQQGKASQSQERCHGQGREELPVELPGKPGLRLLWMCCTEAVSFKLIRHAYSRRSAKKGNRFLCAATRA